MKITVLLFEAGKEPRPKRIPNTLEAMQELVGGNIETVTLDDGIVLVCNEEGYIKGLPANASVVSRQRGGHVIFGDFFICRTEGDEFAGMHNAQDLYMSMNFIVRRFRMSKSV